MWLRQNRKSLKQETLEQSIKNLKTILKNCLQPVCSCSPSSRLSSTQQRPWTSPQIHCSCWPATGQTTSASYLEAQTSRLHQHPAASQQVCNDVETQALCLQGAVLGQFVFFSEKMCHHSACKSSKDKHPPSVWSALTGIHCCPHTQGMLTVWTAQKLRFSQRRYFHYSDFIWDKGHKNSGVLILQEKGDGFTSKEKRTHSANLKV